MSITGKERKKLYLTDLVTGFFASLSKKGYNEVSRGNFRLDLAFENSMPRVFDLALEEDLSVMFRIRTDPFHKDSLSLEGELLSASGRGIVSIDSSGDYIIYRIRIPQEEACSYLENLPGRREFYESVAQEIIDQYARGS